MWSPELPLLQSNVSEKLTKFLLSYTTLRKTAAELSHQLDSKNRLLTEALTAQEEQRQNLETKHRVALESMQHTFETRCQMLEERYREAAEVYQAAEHNQSNLDARYKEALMRLTRQTDEIETLFYAIGLLIRTLGPMRVKIMELISQKRLLQNMVKEAQYLKAGISLLAQALTGKFETLSLPATVSLKRASFRVAAIAVVCYNRLRKYFRKESKCGVIQVGLEKLSIAPSSLISHAKDIPALAVGEDATSLLQLVTHFERRNSTHLRSTQQSLLERIGSGARPQVEKRLNNALALVRKTTLDIMLRLKESERDNEGLHQAIAKLQASYFSVEHSLAHSQEMCVMLETRIHQMQEDGIAAWNEQLLELKASLQEQVKKTADLQQANSHMQSVLQTKEDTIATLRLAVQHRSNELAAIGATQAHINTLNSQLAAINKKVAEKDEALKEYELMVAHLQDSTHTKEHDIQGAQELVARLTEANQTATEKNNVLQHMLDQSRMHIENLKKELRQTLERGVDESVHANSNTKWARVGDKPT